MSEMSVEQQYGHPLLHEELSGIVLISIARYHFGHRTMIQLVSHCRLGTQMHEGSYRPEPTSSGLFLRRLGPSRSSLTQKGKSHETFGV